MPSLPDFADLLGDEIVTVWPTIARIVPAGSILMGGTALAMRLSHRRSEDLDIFTPKKFDPEPMIAALQGAGRFEVERVSATDLHGRFNSVKVEIMCTPVLETLEPPLTVEGLDVGSIPDIMATKLRALATRSTLRDYFDIMCIERQAGISLEEGLVLYTRKFGVRLQDWTVQHIVRALGYLEDVEDDPTLHILARDLAGDDLRGGVVRYFEARHARLARSFQQTLGRGVDL
ncbi:MAG: nucleotidyl transferase AbiEii/AbiGii toxin family protein [bacterium]|nr:nucleotidyl transferase AbiEii/AbiGii toxin family protein [bacterium]